MRGLGHRHNKCSVWLKRQKIHFKKLNHAMKARGKIILSASLSNMPSLHGALLFLWHMPWVDLDMTCRLCLSFSIEFSIVTMTRILKMLWRQHLDIWSPWYWFEFLFFVTEIMTGLKVFSLTTCVNYLSLFHRVLKKLLFCR